MVRPRGRCRCGRPDAVSARGRYERAEPLARDVVLISTSVAAVTVTAPTALLG